MSHLITYSYRAIGGEVVSMQRSLRDNQCHAEGANALLDQFTGSATPLVKIHGCPVTEEEIKRMAGPPVASHFNWKGSAKSYNLKCTWCMKPTTTTPCEHCGSTRVVNPAAPHNCEWFRRTVSTAECKQCGATKPTEEYLNKAAQPWWVVIGRGYGDDECSVHVDQHACLDDAVDGFVEEHVLGDKYYTTWRDENEKGTPLLYIDHVLECATEPKFT